MRPSWIACVCDVRSLAPESGREAEGLADAATGGVPSILLARNASARRYGEPSKTHRTRETGHYDALRTRKYHSDNKRTCLGV